MSDTSAQVAVALIAAFGASALTSVGALGIAAFNARKAKERDEAAHTDQLERDRLEDERRLRDAKRERLREDYVRLVQAGNMTDQVAVELLFVDDETLTTEQWERLERALVDMRDELDKAIVRLTLESEAQSISDLYKDLQESFRDYGRALVHELRTPSDPVSSDAHLNRVKKLLTELRDNARKHLDELSKPM